MVAKYEKHQKSSKSNKKHVLLVRVLTINDGGVEGI